MIEIKDIVKIYGTEKILNNVSLNLESKMTLSILGKSGCGKTTLLKILAGLVIPDAGHFYANSQDMFALPAQERGVVYLSQEPLLFPHLNIFENLAYGLKIRKIESVKIKDSVAKIAQELEIENHLNKMPHQLSGGQKQRVSFGRALIISPKIILLDEPFGSLDAHTRAEMQELFKNIRSKAGMTALFITHDLKEAILMGDKIGLMENGQLKQYNSIQDFAKEPHSGVQSEIDFWKNIL